MLDVVRNSLAEENARLREELAGLYELRAERRLIEFDYPVIPAERDFSKSPHVRRLRSQMDALRTDFKTTLAKFAGLKPKLLDIPPNLDGKPASTAHWLNGWVPGLDAISLYGFVAEKNPPIYFEVGSGNSTTFVRKAISDFDLRTKIISVDPYPRAEIDEICDTVYRVPFEHFDLDKLSMLTPDDVVFIDNSHRSFMNSDVTVFFMEMLGLLPKGILYGIHDIHLPYDYPEYCLPHLWNEQYLLATYLFGGADGDQIVLPSYYITMDPELRSELDTIWTDPHFAGIYPSGGSFWMRKG